MSKSIALPVIALALTLASGQSRCEAQVAEAAAAPMFGAVSPEAAGAVLDSSRSAFPNAALSPLGGLLSADLGQDSSRAALWPVLQALSEANHPAESLKDLPVDLQQAVLKDAWQKAKAVVFTQAAKITGTFLSPGTDEASLASSLDRMSRLQTLYPAYLPAAVLKDLEATRSKAADRLRAMQAARIQAEVGATTSDWLPAQDQPPSGDALPVSDNVKKAMGDLLRIGNEATSLQYLEALAKAGSQADRMFIVQGLTDNYASLAYRFHIGTDIVGTLARVATATSDEAVQLSAIKRMLDRCVFWTHAIGLIDYRDTLTAIADVAASNHASPTVKRQAVLWIETEAAQAETMSEGDHEFIYDLVKRIRISAGLDVPPPAR